METTNRPEEVYHYPHDCINDGFCDFQLFYNPETKKYFFSMETLLGFEDEEKGPKYYLKDILCDFTEWMADNGYKTSKKCSFWEYFCTKGVEQEHDSVEAAYAVFRRAVKGFLYE